MSARTGQVQWIELRPRDPATAGLATLRFAGGAVERSYFREENNQHYKAGVVSAPRFAARIGFGRDGFTGQTVPQASRIQIAPAEPAVFESLAGYFWKDAEISIDAGPEDAATFPRLFTGTVVGDSIADGVFTLTIADLSTRLDKPVCDKRFAGNGGIEGGEEAEGRTKRRSWGYVFNVEGRLLDPANSIYEFGDPAFPLSGFSALRDKGRTGPFTVLAWQGSIAATFAALQASSPAQGGGVVAPSIACAKWWTQPSGPLTADFIGTPGTGGSMAVASLIDAVSARFSGPAVTNRTAGNALRPAAAGIHVGDENTTGAQVIDRLALGSSLIWVAAPEGVIRLLPWTFDNGGAEVLQGQFIGRERAHAPHYRRRVGFQANNRRHSESEIAESIRLDDGVLFDSLRPYEADATAGAVIPDPQTYVPGDTYPGYVRDSTGNVRDPGELLNSEIELTAAGRLQYRPLPDVAPVSLGQIRLPDLNAVSQDAFRRAEDDIDQMATALAVALDEASRTRATFTDAGFYVDAATGQVRIHAIEQTRERVSTAEIRLNAAEANINIRATNSYVNEQIALAAFDPSQIAELTDIFLRLGAAEVDIDGLNATVTTLATVTELSLVQGRVSTAEEAIDALEGTITSKVDTTTFDALATRVTNAETVLTAIGDTASILSSVSAVRLVEKAQEANAEQDLWALLQGDRTKREQVAAIAAARQELTARIIDGDMAEAAFRLALQVRVGAAEASLATESLTRATADSALANQITTLSASTTTSLGALTAALDAEIDAREGDVATLTASITTEQSARTDADSALASDISDLSASLTTAAGTLQTNINDANQARIDGDAALASSITTLNAELDTEVSNRAAAVSDEAQARIDGDGLIAAGLAQQVTAARVLLGEASELADLLLGSLLNNDRNRREVNGAVAGARQEITAQIVSEVEALSTRILALVARVAGNEASIVEESIARVTAVESLASTITTLNASFTGALSAEATARTSAIAAEATTRATAISNEAAARATAIGEEATTRATLISGLESDIGSAIIQIGEEEAARIAAINAEAAARGTAITAEESARIAAINAEAAARSAAVTTLTASISSEATARASADGALAGQITTLNTTVGAQSATLTTFGESINGLKARWGAKVDVNGRVGGFVLNGTSDDIDAIFVVDNFKVVDPDTGTAFLDADADGLRLQNGKIIMNNGTNMLVMGAGFGVDNQFVMWFGPSRAISACNEADALFFLDVTGDGEYGLRLGSNFYKNSGTGTSLASNAQIIVGPFVTDGGSKQVSIGYTYFRNVQITDAFVYTGAVQAVLRVERSVNSGTWATVGDYTFNGTATGFDGFGPSEPGSATIQINQAASFTDTTSGTGTFSYRATIISRSVDGLTSTVSLEDALNQTFTLISTEQIT
ncbi:hypothetical protein IP68_04910 [Blastomonas sp. AAP25]|uniref:hypothetical protein n=1 Tax=Blastomonas sp. AAP25 TaxID=1523416 RepID=UPI0006B99BC2|nr:hypothetical protein [Blastomonas sp. AAP25]KPF75874.1 hypothetical protein IP68_04910 [Blastomonas sp. AAP25]